MLDINAISAWVTWADMELRSYLPRVPFLPAGPTGPLGKKGNLWEVVRNSISAHVTHAEIPPITINEIFCVIRVVFLVIPITTDC